MRLFMLLLAACASDPSAIPDAASVELDAESAWPSAPPTTFVDPSGLRPPATLIAASYDPTIEHPLVVFLPGRGQRSSAAEVVQVQGLAGLVDRGYLILLVDSETDQDGNHLWNASTACCDSPYHLGYDDVGYVGALLDRVLAVWHVDRHSITLDGQSNGGFLAEAVACAHADVVTGIVNIAGAGRSANDPPCAPSKPVAVLEAHGTNDTTITLAGNTRFAADLDPYPGTFATAAQWTTRNGCSGPVVLVADHWRDHDAIATANETDLFVAPGCAASVSVWRMNGTPHIPQYDAAWSLDVETWIEQNRRPR